ncbi:MAG: 50S ribosome-binding GTPase [Candidatus Aenigmarchaeota archaeon]|nr:50S ribosome-binding GTPase [Candidatus Aenigmarchaeota archaeon]
MPVNAGPEYGIAERRFQEAKTKEQKIAALEEMIRTLPKHKGTDHMLAQLRKRLARLRDEAEAASKSGKSTGVGLRKEGAAQVCMIGPTQSGKSTLLNSLSNAQVKVSDHAFTTKKPNVGMMFYGDVPIQVIEIPSTFDAQYLSIARTCDLILVLLDSTQDVTKQEAAIKKLLDDKAITVQTIFVRNKRFVERSKYINVSAKDGFGLDGLKDLIWKKLNLIRVYTKSPNGKKQLPPVAMRPGSTVRQLTSNIHKEFLKTFMFARVFNETKYSGQKVGLDYVLKDMDVVEIHTEI